MSLQPGRLRERGRRFRFRDWVRLLGSPLLALALCRVLPWGDGAAGGWFLIAVSPGAPLLTRNLARRGFDMYVAVGYQVWGALAAPMMIPWLVFGGAWLSGRSIWTPPREILWLVTTEQFLPLLAGIALARMAPVGSAKARRVFNLAGKSLLGVIILGLRYRLGPALQTVSIWRGLAVLILAAGFLAAAR